MKFYQECLGGDLVIQSIGESPMADQLPDWMKSYVLHSTLTTGGVVIMGSDMTNGGLIHGNNISLLLNCSSEEQIRECFERLSEEERRQARSKKRFGDHCSDRSWISLEITGH